MYQPASTTASIMIQLAERDRLIVSMVEPVYDPGHPQIVISIANDNGNHHAPMVVYRGSVEQLLTFAASAEQTARMWMMERDGVSKEGQAAVLAVSP